MAEQPEVLREQIRETHESLASKISTLEDKVVGTVNNTAEAVTETVETVKEKVSETIQTVKRTFDLEYQVREHPWSMMAGAVGAGFLTARLLPGATRSAKEFVSHLKEERPSSRSPYLSPAAATPAPNGQDNAPGQGSLLSHLADQFHDELEQVKGVALGTLFGLARDWAIQNLPDKLAPHVQEVLDNITTKLGGTKIDGPVMENR
jgi:hypothetical protein